MIENQAAWLDWLLSPAIEGGLAERPHADDPGGVTKYGITVAALSAYRHRPPENPCTAEDVRKLTLEEARDIAVASYWGRCGATLAPGGLDWCLADFSFHSGPRTAVRRLQRLLGLSGPDVDGYNGPKTQRAIQARDTAGLIEDQLDDRLEYLKGLPSWPPNAHGWTNRIHALRDRALALAPRAAPQALVAQDHLWRRAAGYVSIGGGALLGALPVLMAALPDARDAAGQVQGALAPYGADIPWLSPVVGAATCAGVLFLKLRGSTMAKRAELSGAAAAVVAPGPGPEAGR